MAASKIHHTEAYNEVGELVYFDIPTAAMHYETNMVSIVAEERIQAKVEKLATEYCAKADKPDAFFDSREGLDGKIKFVAKLRKSGWGKKYKIAKI